MVVRYLVLKMQILLQVALPQNLGGVYLLRLEQLGLEGAALEVAVLLLFVGVEDVVVLLVLGRIDLHLVHVLLLLLLLLEENLRARQGALLVHKVFILSGNFLQKAHIVRLLDGVLIRVHQLVALLVELLLLGELQDLLVVFVSF